MSKRADGDTRTEAILTAWTCREALGWFRPLDEEARRG